MIILKVKEWMKNPNAQFRIKKEHDGIIYSVTRLKDGVEFEKDYFYETFDKSGMIKIEKFESDLVHVEVYIYWMSNYYRRVELNDIVFNKDGTVILKEKQRRPRKRVSPKQLKDNDPSIWL